MKYKFPRIPHLPWSESVSDDDIISLPDFVGKEVIVTRKMDGENFTGHKLGCHARSPDSRNHVSRNWATNFWMERSWKLPDGWRISAENVYAKHSVAYTDLPGYLLGFGSWDENLFYRGWDDTCGLMVDLDIPMVEVLWRGIWDEKTVRNLWNSLDRECHEGYVVRSAAGFSLDDFGKNVRKFVRLGHVQTDKHWMHSEIIPNTLKPS